MPPSARRFSVLTMLACLALLGASGCGGGGDASTTSTSAGAATTTSPSGPSGHQPAPQGAPAGSAKGAQGGSAKGAQGGSGKGSVPGDTSAGFTPEQHGDSGGGSAQFEQKGGDNSIQESGSEASGSEFAQAAGALHGYLDARATGAWAAACTYLAAGVSEQLSQLSAGGAGGSGGSGAKPSCAELLAALSAGVPPSALREAAVADVAALRVEGDSAFLLFHGAHGTDYFVPMAREGSTWKVAAIAPSALQ